MSDSPICLEGGPLMSDGSHKLDLDLITLARRTIFHQLNQRELTRPSRSPNLSVRVQCARYLEEVQGTSCVINYQTHPQPIITEIVLESAS
jgi:hypothetical protein